MRVGPSRLISTARSSGESNDTVAAEWMTTSAVAHSARCSSLKPSPSELTSPATVWIRRAVMSANVSDAPSAACCSRRRSNASFFNSSFSTRFGAGVRRPSRTRRINSQSGTLRRSRSTSAVPTNPVDPVMAMRLPASDSAITMNMSTIW